MDRETLNSIYLTHKISQARETRFSKDQRLHESRIASTNEKVEQGPSDILLCCTWAYVCKEHSPRRAAGIPAGSGPRRGWMKGCGVSLSNCKLSRRHFPRLHRVCGRSCPNGEDGCLSPRSVEIAWNEEWWWQDISPQHQISAFRDSWFSECSWDCGCLESRSQGLTHSALSLVKTDTEDARERNVGGVEEEHQGVKTSSSISNAGQHPACHESGNRAVWMWALCAGIPTFRFVLFRLSKSVYTATFRILGLNSWGEFWLGILGASLNISGGSSIQTYNSKTILIYAQTRFKHYIKSWFYHNLLNYLGSNIILSQPQIKVWFVNPNTWEVNSKFPNTNRLYFFSRPGQPKEEDCPGSLWEEILCHSRPYRKDYL